MPVSRRMTCLQTYPLFLGSSMQILQLKAGVIPAELMRSIQQNLNDY